MGFLKFLAAVAVGFVGAMLLVLGITLAMDPVDPAAVGGIHIVSWVFLSWFFHRTFTSNSRASKGRGGSQDQNRVGSVPAKPGDQTRSTPPPEFGTTDELEDEAALDERPARKGRRRVFRVGAAVLVGVGVIGLAATAGFGVAKNTVPETTTTTTTTAAPVLGGWGDLTDNERVWCLRDRETDFRRFRAAEALGFWEFEASLFNYREGKAGSGDPVNADLQSWKSAAGTDIGRQHAVSCRAAFETR